MIFLCSWLCMCTHTTTKILSTTKVSTQTITQQATNRNYSTYKNHGIHTPLDFYDKLTSFIFGLVRTHIGIIMGERTD